ncbi:MAG: DUF4143 domain-containing protein [Candidatus Omnitrophota bacterium]
MIERIISKYIVDASDKSSLVALVGTNGAGKTSLVKSTFPGTPYVSLEDFEMREAAISYPQGFIVNYPKGAVFDDIQRAPELFYHLLKAAKNNELSGKYIITGSPHFFSKEKISESFDGELAIFRLLPFSLEELSSASITFDTYEECLLKGFYPNICLGSIEPYDWYQNYIHSLAERDIRLIVNVRNLMEFQRFLKLCASRIGYGANCLALANDCGITHNTATAWFDLLKANGVIYLLKPHHINYIKRLAKTPRLYFVDPGIACSLLGINGLTQISFHPFKNALFKSMIISEMFKYFYNRGLKPNFFFWRNKLTHEVNLLIEKEDKVIPIIFTSDTSIDKTHFKNLVYFRKLSKIQANESYLIYGGNTSYQHSLGNVVSWREATTIL